MSFVKKIHFFFLLTCYHSALSLVDTLHPSIAPIFFAVELHISSPPLIFLFVFQMPTIFLFKSLCRWVLGFDLGNGINQLSVDVGDVS